MANEAQDGMLFHSLAQRNLNICFLTLFSCVLLFSCCAAVSCCTSSKIALIIVFQDTYMRVTHVNLALCACFGSSKIAELDVFQDTHVRARVKSIS